MKTIKAWAAAAMLLLSIGGAAQQPGVADSRKDQETAQKLNQELISKLDEVLRNREFTPTSDGKALKLDALVKLESEAPGKKRVVDIQIGSKHGLKGNLPVFVPIELSSANASAAEKVFEKGDFYAKLDLKSTGHSFIEACTGERICVEVDDKGKCTKYVCKTTRTP